MKSTFETENEPWLEEIVEILRSQILVTLQKEEDDLHPEVSLTPYSLGYLFGFCTGGFLMNNVSQSLEQLKLLTRVYARLFGSTGSDILHTSRNLLDQDDALFKEGSISGLEDFLAWHYRKEQATGLLLYTLHHKPSQKEIISSPFQVPAKPLEPALAK